jgi:hypothetical protein
MNQAPENAAYSNDIKYITNEAPAGAACNTWANKVEKSRMSEQGEKKQKKNKYKKQKTKPRVHSWQCLLNPTAIPTIGLYTIYNHFVKNNKKIGVDIYRCSPENQQVLMRTNESRTKKKKKTKKTGNLQDGLGARNEFRVRRDLARGNAAPQRRNERRCGLKQNGHGLGQGLGAGNFGKRWQHGLVGQQIENFGSWFLRHRCSPPPGLHVGWLSARSRVLGGSY